MRSVKTFAIAVLAVAACKAPVAPPPDAAQVSVDRWRERHLLAMRVAAEHARRLPIHDLPVPANVDMPASEVAGFDTKDGVLVPRLATNVRESARVRLPATADAPFTLRDAQTGLAIDVKLAGASKAPAEIVDGVVVYRGAANGSDVVHRVTGEGTEDFVWIERATDPSELVYEVALRDRVAGLRLVSNVLEFLDESGAPRLRVAPPYLLDADGRRHEARLDVRGCAVDSNPAPPWGRPTTRPGADTCAVRIAWNGARAAFPLLVDPVWMVTASLAVARGYLSVVPLADGRVLAAGGFNGSSATSATELYDPATRAWASVASLADARSAFTLTRLGDGRVLAAGGYNQSATNFTLLTSEIYTPASGTWSGTGPLSIARREHAAVALNDGRVIVAGGQGRTYVTGSAELYQPWTGTWTVVGYSSARKGHVAERLANGDVIVASGTDGSSVLSSAQVFNPSSNTWRTVGSLGVARTNAASTMLPDGRVFLAGGSYASGTPSSYVELYDPVSERWSYANSMRSRDRLTLTSLASGRVVAAGGWDGNAVTMTEQYTPSTGSWAFAGYLREARYAHGAVLVGPAAVFVVGGAPRTGYGFLRSTEVLATTCGSDVDCLAGSCVDGFCCDTLCAGSCDRCDLSGREGICSAVPEGSAGAPACAPYACSGTSGSCPTTCTSSSQCATGHHCESGACVPPSPTGAPCLVGTDCASGSCADATCCDTACAGGCDRCNLTGSVGTCTTLPAGDAGQCWPYICQGSAACPTSCSADAECGAGYFCNASKQCAAKRSNGASCGLSNECTSGICVDGVCCNAACTEPCDRCNQSGWVGTCVTAAAGYAGSNPSCFPYVCSGSSLACPSSCTVTSQCAPGQHCEGGACVAPSPIGATCVANGDCASSYCADGRCCNTSCAYACDRCDLNGSLGTCTVLAAGEVGGCSPYRCGGIAQCPSACYDESQCAPGFTCEGSVCVPKRANGATCVAAGGCLSGHCVDGYCCDTACSGVCDGCGLAFRQGTCSPLPVGTPATSCSPYACNGTSASCPTSCTASAQCASGHYCSPAGRCEPKLQLGASCLANGDCTSGACADGVCCNGACGGGCDRCDVAGSVGTCTTLAAGTPGTACGRYLCSGTSASCRTTCAADAECTTDSFCSGGACVAKLGEAATCSRAAQCASGSCVDGFCCESACGGGCDRCDVVRGRCTLLSSGDPGSCSPFVCGGASADCPTSCTADAQCAAGRWCSGGACLLKKAKGASCGEARECTSGFCANGVCCDAACGSACDRCDLAATRGTCSTSPLGDPGAPSCAPFACNGVFPTCPSSCSSDAGCASGLICESGACVPKLVLGKPCASGARCASGFCADGVCCDGACTGACNRCNFAGQQGQCLVAPDGAEGEAPSCGTYLCDGESVSCPSSCAHDSDCARGSFCGGGVCLETRTYGTPCTRAEECSSGICSDGLCCTRSCEGACARCDSPAAPGVCRPKAAGSASDGSACSPLTCDGASEACPAACSDDAGCIEGRYCEGGACLEKRAAGESCSTARECGSGFCADGVCCDGECSGACDRCDLTASRGRCAPAPAGDAGAPSCAPRVCDGASGRCPTSCIDSGGCTPNAYCASGLCVVKHANGTACGESRQCASGFCVDGFCCETACTGQCSSCAVAGQRGLCRPVTGAPVGGREACAGDGSACQGRCDGVKFDVCTYPGPAIACRAPSCSAGVATARAVCDGTGACPAISQKECAPFECGANACLGECAEDGDCVPGHWCDAGRCEPKRAPGEACRTANACATGFCSDGLCCDGACGGSCDRCDLAGAEGRCTLFARGDEAGGACAPLRCDGVSAACPSACADDADCLDGDRCAGGVCVRYEALGAACSNGDECASGFCVDGVCCDGACEGTCATCNLPGREGRCAFVVGAPLATRGSCAGEGVCAGACRGNGPECVFPGDAQTCGPAFCSDGIAVARSVCDGAGTCSAGAIETCVSGLCAGAACESVGPSLEFTAYGSGCACGSASPSAIALLAFAVLAFARRRRGARP